MEALFRVAHRTHFIEMAHFMVVAGAVVHVAFLAVLLMCQLDWHATWNPATVGVAVAGLLAFIGLQTFLTYKADNAQVGASVGLGSYRDTCLSVCLRTSQPFERALFCSLVICAGAKTAMVPRLVT